MDPTPNYPTPNLPKEACAFAIPCSSTDVPSATVVESSHRFPETAETIAAASVDQSITLPPAKKFAYFIDHLKTSPKRRNILYMLDAKITHLFAHRICTDEEIPDVIEAMTMITGHADAGVTGSCQMTKLRLNPCTDKEVDRLCKEMELNIYTCNYKEFKQAICHRIISFKHAEVLYNHLVAQLPKDHPFAKRRLVFRNGQGMNYLQQLHECMSRIDVAKLIVELPNLSSPEISFLHPYKFPMVKKLRCCSLDSEGPYIDSRFFLKFPNVVDLSIRSYRIIDLSPLSSLTALQKLSLSCTVSAKKTDITFLSELKHLQELLLSLNFDELSPRNHVAHLPVLYDISILRNLSRLRELTLQRLHPQLNLAPLTKLRLQSLRLTNIYHTVLLPCLPNTTSFQLEDVHSWPDFSRLKASAISTLAIEPSNGKPLCPKDRKAHGITKFQRRRLKTPNFFLLRNVVDLTLTIHQHSTQVLTHLDKLKLHELRLILGKDVHEITLPKLPTLKKLPIERQFNKRGNGYSVDFLCKTPNLEAFNDKIKREHYIATNARQKKCSHKPKLTSLVKLETHSFETLSAKQFPFNSKVTPFIDPSRIQVFSFSLESNMFPYAWETLSCMVSLHTLVIDFLYQRPPEDLRYFQRIGKLKDLSLLNVSLQGHVSLRSDTVKKFLLSTGSTMPYPYWDINFPNLQDLELRLKWYRRPHYGVMTQLAKKTRSLKIIESGLSNPEKVILSTEKKPEDMTMNQYIKKTLGYIT